MNIKIGDKFKNYQETEYKIIEVTQNGVKVEVTNYNGVKNVWEPDIEYFTKCNLVKLPKHKVGEKVTTRDIHLGYYIKKYEVKDILLSSLDGKYKYYCENIQVNPSEFELFDCDELDENIFENIEWDK